MKGTIYVIKPDGSVTRTDLTSEPTFGMIKLGIDNGTLEVVPMFDVYEGMPCVAFCDEDGKGKALPLNRVATILWCQAIVRRVNITKADLALMNDVLVGPIVVLTGDREFMNSI